MSASSRLFLDFILLSIGFSLNLVKLNVKGNDELPHVFEHMVYVEIAQNKEQHDYFVGCILTENMILVSSNYESYRSGEQLIWDQYVVVGTRNHREKANTTEIIEVKRLISYAPPTFEDDYNKVELPSDVIPEVALIVLKSDITMRLKNISVMPLPRFQFATDYKECVVVSWGNNLDRSSEYDEVKEYVVNIVDQATCNPAVNSFHYRFCIDFNDICHIAPGSPVVCDGELIGLVTDEPNCRPGSMIAVNLRACDNIHYHLDWIYSNIEDPLLPTPSSSCALQLHIIIAILKSYLSLLLLLSSK
uniref:Peptidase S1 domain-containing protein n=1 Tax=Glossina palpalis gambiensis TaxID=67801 RepID=A0A1B0AV03_9MUSC